VENVLCTASAATLGPPMPTTRTRSPAAAADTSLHFSFRRPTTERTSHHPTPAAVLPAGLQSDAATTAATAPKHSQNAFSGVPRRSFRAQSSQYARALPPLELFAVGHPSDITHYYYNYFETQRRKTIGFFFFFTRTRVDIYDRRPSTTSFPSVFREYLFLLKLL